jgi:hypothetical protein
MLQQHIDNRKAQAAARSRIAGRTTNHEQQAHSTRLSDELRLLAKQLKTRRDRPQ